MSLSLNRRHFLALTGAAAVLHPFSLRAAAGQAHLRLMETTDLHVHVFPYDYYGDRETLTAGLSRTAAHIKAIRAEATNSLLFDNGDFLQGNPMGDYIAYEKGLNAGDLHPVIAAMNTLGYDAGTLGNHEFNYGLDYLATALAEANFPLACANACLSQGATALEDKTLLPPYLILERSLTDGTGATHPIKIGVIGFVPPQVVEWDRAHLEGKLTTRDIVETAQSYVPQMKAEGADLILALCHSGIGAPEHEAFAENAAIALAAVEGIDALMLGHAHRLLPGTDYEGIEHVDAANGTIHGKPAIMPGFWGSHLGSIDLLLERQGDTWAILSAQSLLHPISARDAENKLTATVEDSPEILAAAQTAHDETLAYVRRAVGQTEAPLHSYFALVADDPSLQIVSQAQLWYVESLLKGTEYASLPLLSAVAPFKAGGRNGPDYYTDVPVGPVAIKNVADLYLYPNTVMAVHVTGAQLQDWLERAAGIFNQIEAGSTDSPLINSAFPSFNYDVIDGLTYQIDLSAPSKYDPATGDLVAPEANRIKNLAYQGTPVDLAAQFVVATNNYRAGGGGNFPGLDGSNIILQAPDTNRDVIVRYILEQGTINPAADGNWSFVPMPDTSLLFETGPKASAYAADVPNLKIEAAGDGADGFALFRITF